jgi:hypothetical protein
MEDQHVRKALAVELAPEGAGELIESVDMRVVSKRLCPYIA